MGPWGLAFLFCLMSTVAGTCALLRRSWNFNSVDGRIITAARWIRRVSRNSDQKPNRNRSSIERLGARRRERLMARSCCFMSRLSATTALAPPGPRSLAMVVNRCARSTSRSFMAEQGREGGFQEQVCLSYRFQVIIINSPSTRSCFSKFFQKFLGHIFCQLQRTVSARIQRVSNARESAGFELLSGFAEIRVQTT